MKKPNPVDIHVGRRIRLRRTLMGMSQEKLGTAVTLTFQQIQKYESGANRVGSSRLFQFSKVLSVPVSFFFDDMPPEISGAPAGLREDTVPFNDNIMTKRESLNLVRHYYRLPNERIRKHVRDLLAELARSDPISGS